MISSLPDSQALSISASLDALAGTKPPAMRHFRLPNGLSVYLYEDHDTAQVAVQLWCHVGASHEPPGHSNLSHLLEHLLFKGSSKVPAEHFSRVIARLGGMSNATTHDDATAFEVTLPAARLPVALEILADAMAHATLDQAAFEQEVKTVDDERRLKVDNSPIERAYDQHRALAHGDNAYASLRFGQSIDLAQMSLESVRTWYRTWYQPNNATLVVAGDVTVHRLRQAVTTYFATLPPASLRIPPAPRHAAELDERSQQLTEPGLRPGLFMSFNVPSLATATSLETALALHLISDLLGSGFSALLYSRLVRDRQILKFPNLSYESQLRGDALLTLSAYTAPGISPQDAAAEVWSIIDGLRSTPLPDALLDRAKLGLLARQVYESGDAVHQATRIGHAAAAGLDPLAYETHPGIIRGLCGATVQQVARDYLCRERLTTTYLLQGVSA